MIAKILADIIHVFSIVLIALLFFSFPLRDYKHRGLIYSMIPLEVLAVSVGIYYIDNVYISGALYFISIMIVFLVLFERKVFKLIISATWIMFVLAVLDIMYKVFVDIILFMIGFDTDKIEEIIVAILSFIVVGIAGLVFNKKYNKRLLDVGVVPLIIFTLVATAETFVVTLMSTVVYERAMNNILFLIAFCVVIVGFFFFLAIIIMLFIQRNIYKEQKQNVETYLKAQKSHYEYLEKKEHETKKFRHDLQSHMKLMSKFIEENNYEEFKRYYEKINDKIESFKSQVTVYNGIADAIINQYYSIAVSKGIDMKVSGRFPVDCDIDTYDLCTIFSNILSNAVEAAERAENKRIKLECKYSDNKELFIFLNNTYKDIGIIESKKIRTRKNDSDYHGYGMENVEDSVKKYKGSYYYEIEDNEFKVTILLNY